MIEIEQIGEASWKHEIEERPNYSEVTIGFNNDDRPPTIFVMLYKGGYTAPLVLKGAWRIRGKVMQVAHDRQFDFKSISNKQAPFDALAKVFGPAYAQELQLALTPFIQSKSLSSLYRRLGKGGEFTKSITPNRLTHKGI